MIPYQIAFLALSAFCFINAYQLHEFIRWQTKFNLHKNAFWRNHMPIPLFEEDLELVRKHGVERAVELSGFDIDLYVESLEAYDSDGEHCSF